MQGMIQRQRVEMSDLNVKIMREHQKAEHHAAISDQLENQLRDTQREIKARLLKRLFTITKRFYH